MAEEKSLSTVTYNSESILGAEEKSTADSVKQVVPKKDTLPLRLLTPHGERLHEQMCVEYDVTARHCETCGKTGQLTCFLPCFRSWDLKRATPEELNRKCNRCGEVGHNCLECDIPITYNWVPATKRKLGVRRITKHDEQCSSKGL